MRFKEIFFGLVLFVVFSSLIVTPIVLMANNYGVDTMGIGEGALNDGTFNSSLSDISGSTENYRRRYDTAITEADDETAESDGWGLFGIIGDIVNLITTPFTLLSQVIENIIGIPKVYSNIIMGGIGISIILALWRLWKQGE